MNRSMPPLEIEVRLTVHDAGGTREAGPYYDHHRPWDMLDDTERARARRGRDRYGGAIDSSQRPSRLSIRLITPIERSA